MYNLPVRFLFCLFAIFSCPVLAQQSLFNVPSGEVTPRHKVFFQEQLGFSGRQVQLNTVTCFGLGGGFEMGIDLLNLDLNLHSGPLFDINDTGHDEPLSPLGLLTALYGRQIVEGWHAALGVQVGANLLGRSVRQGAGMIYFNNRFDLPWLSARLYVGAFAASAAYLGVAAPQANIMLGLEVPLVPEGLDLVADHLHGLHALGLTVIGVAWHATPTFIVSGGLQIPNLELGQNRLPYAAVVELTVQPHD